MGHILGIASVGRVVPEWLESFRAGSHLLDGGEGRPAGWGLGCYLGGSPVHLARSPGSHAVEAPAFSDAAGRAYLSSSRFVLCQLGGGDGTVDNVYPMREKEWLFTLAGTVDGVEALPPGRFDVRGTLPGERLFKYLLSLADLKSTRGLGRAIEDGIAYAARVCLYDSLNFMLTDNRHLVVYRYSAAGGERHPLFRAELRGRAVFSSVPFPGFEWEPVENGTLVIIDRRANVVYERMTG